MAKGVPIRLVQENGKLIELDATNMTLTTERKVGGAPLPFTGSMRFGADYNVNTAFINIQGVIVDDREGSSSAKASSLINFGRKSGAGNGVPWASYVNIRALLDSIATRRRIRLKSTNGSSNFVSFTESGSLISGEVAAYSSNGGAGSTPTILVFLSSDLQSASDSTVDAAQNLLAKKIAAALIAYIGAQLSSKFTASLVNTSNQEGNRDTYGVKITQVLFGTGGNNSTPFFSVSGGTNQYNTPSFEAPLVTLFSGGTTGGKKSAGDKAMDLYGILNNSVTDAGRKLAGGVALVGGIAGAVLGAAATGGASVVGGGAVALAGLNVLVNPLDNDEKDYIIGIQIPYNSTITASDGELYTARNFFMPTGFGKHGLLKTSVNNTNAASVEFDTSDAFTGIQGAVQKMDISYDAGETVYNFNMVFAPVDVLI
tara:strand:- start:221 stop:1504 length:1284 start_codon:yes stop_codon:yes gene_type:complete